MGSSAKCKHIKGKGKSMLRKSENVSRQPGTSTSDPDMSQRKRDSLSDFEKTKDENLHTEVNLNMDMGVCEKETKCASEILLYSKLELLYAEAFRNLVSKDHEIEKARYGILRNGHWVGEKSILWNIVDNAHQFLTSGVVTDKEAPNGYTDMSQRVESLMRMLMREKQHMFRDCNEIDAMKLLVGIDVGLGYGAASLTNPHCVQIENRKKGDCSADCPSGDNSEECDSCGGDTSCINKIVPEEDIGEPSQKGLSSPNELEASTTYALPSSHILPGDDLDWEDPVILRLLEKNPDDQKDVLILSALKQYKDLTEQVKESKQWALEKARQAEQKVNSHLSEIKRLRIENLGNQPLKADIQFPNINNVKSLREMDTALWNAMFQLEQATATVRQHELQNSEVREHIERYRLDASKSNKALKEVERRERKCLKRVAVFEKEKNLSQEQVEEQKQKVLQLNQELFQLNKSQEETEAKLAEELKEKELAIALLAEEERLRNIAEANLRAKQALLRQRVETNLQVLKDDLHKLEDELATLRISRNESFEVTIPEAYVLRDSPEEVSGRECVICSKNDASILFLPCAHQVVCTKCNEEEIVGTRCPYCQVQIEERVTIYGANS